MALQRYFIQATKQYISRHSVLHASTKQSYCVLHQRHSSDSSRKYTDRHEWVTIYEGIGTIGISKYAQESLGDVVFAQLPDVGMNLEAGNECGALESVKAASEIYSPLSGVVTEKNKEVEDKPGLINSSCYDKGWLFKLKLTEPDEVKDLMTEEQYETFLKTDIQKEKDT